MKRIKILQVVPSLSRVNGVASYAMNYYRNISNIDMDFVVANLDTKSDYFEEINANGNKIYNLSKNLSKNFIDYIYKIKKFFKENANKYDIIHCHVANAGAIFLYYAKKYGIKVRIIHSHATATSDNKIKQIRNNLILPLTIHNATNYFACSDKAGKAMFKNKKYLNQVLIPIAVLIILITMTPLNVIDLPGVSQKYVLETLLPTGKNFEDLTEKEKARVADIYQYLRGD